MDTKPTVEEIKESELQKINRQPPENRIENARRAVEVVNIFLTIQGEGPFHGYPSVFIRTAGCNLDCPLCDTDYTTNRHFLEPPQIVDRVQELRRRCLVVFTGGEPFRQNLTPTVLRLLSVGFSIQIETNGTYYWPEFPYQAESFAVVCSPKTPKLHPKMPVDYYKYVVDAQNISEDDGLPLSVLGNGIAPARPRDTEGDIPVYVSPADEYNEEKNEKNLRAAIQSCLKFDYLLSVQEHKLWGMP